MSLRFLFLILFALTFSSSLQAQNSALSLDEAISIALKNNPEVLSSERELQARQARVSQSGAIPNPDLVILTEDFAGTGEFESFTSSQTTVQLSQRFELGGKRDARQKAASLHRDVGVAEIELKQQEIRSSVRRHFFAVLLNQQRVQWMRDLLQIAKQFSGTVIERINAGKIPPIDEVKASSIVATAEVDLARSMRDLESARYDLAALLGTSEPHFQSVRGEIPVTPELNFETILQALPVTQEMKRAEILVEESRALLSIEESKSFPDLTVTGGYRKLQTTDDSAFVAGVSIPLPLFDRNKGGIEEANQRLRKSEDRRAAAALQLRSTVSKALRTYSAARSEAEALREKVVPANQTSLDAISEGYKLGKYGLLDVLEAQRSLYQSRLQLLRALEEIYGSAAELERFTGSEILQLSGPMEAHNE